MERRAVLLLGAGLLVSTFVPKARGAGNREVVALERDVHLGRGFSKTGNFVGKISSHGARDYYFPVDVSLMRSGDGAITVEFVAENNHDSQCAALKGHVEKFGKYNTSESAIRRIVGHVAGHGFNAGDIEDIINYAKIRWLRENHPEDYEKLVAQNKYIEKFGIGMADAVERYDRKFMKYHNTYSAQVVKHGNDSAHHLHHH